MTLTHTILCHQDRNTFIIKDPSTAKLGSEAVIMGVLGPGAGWGARLYPVALKSEILTLIDYMTSTIPLGHIVVPRTHFKAGVEAILTRNEGCDNYINRHHGVVGRYTTSATTIPMASKTPKPAEDPSAVGTEFFSAPTILSGQALAPRSSLGVATSPSNRPGPTLPRYMLHHEPDGAPFLVDVDTPSIIAALKHTILQFL
ncbi:hypothetical protein C8J57DRAFT_1219531 [Mycena rebaudengoi]|nr:hypothetical protein C8J57DRAFT_1219531 [Mycena rebaudengoi]